MRVVTANIKCNPKMKQPWVLSDIRHVGAVGGVLMGQEIETARYKEAWKDVLRHLGMSTFGLTEECPISFKQRYWRYGETEIRLMHKGKRLTSPNRYCTVVKTARRKDGMKVAFMNTHFVSGGWHKGFKANRQWRKDMWAVHFKKMKEWIAELNLAGYTVVIGGDFNRVTLPPFHADQVELHHHGLDHLLCVPAVGVRVDIQRKVAYGKAAGMHTDHPVLATTFTLNGR